MKSIGSGNGRRGRVEQVRLKTRVEFKSFSFFSNFSDDRPQEQCQELGVIEHVCIFNLFCDSFPQEA